MSNIKSMGYESILEPGAAVVFGSESGVVDLPGDAGAGIPAGVVSADSEQAYAYPDTEDSAPVTRMGPAKVLAGEQVVAGEFGYVNDNTGQMKGLPADAGLYWSYGQFEEDGAAGEFVEFNVNIQQITVEAAG